MKSERSELLGQDSSACRHLNLQHIGLHWPPVAAELTRGNRVIHLPSVLHHPSDLSV